MLEIIIKSLIFIALAFVAVLYYRKTKNAKHSSVRILLGILLLTMLLSYLIPGTQISGYGINKDNVIPVGFADTYSNGLIGLNISLQTIVYLLVIGVFYTILKCSGAYEDIVEKTAATYKKYKSLFIVLTVLGLGLSSLFTGEIYAMIGLVPFLISVIRKLGYSKEIAISSTVGAILLGRIGTLYSVYSDQFLNLTVKDNVMIKVLLSVIALVLLITFIIVFGKKPEKNELNGTNSNKKVKLIVGGAGFLGSIILFVILWLVSGISLGLVVGGLALAALGLALIVLEYHKDGKTMFVNMVFYLLFVILLMGFVPWEQYFGYKGFNEFLTSLREFKLFGVSVFDAFVGSQNSVAAFGTWQLYNASILFIFVGVILAFRLKTKVSELPSVVVEGIRKSVPYAIILAIASTILVVAYQSGVLSTITIELTKDGFNLFKGSIVSTLSAVFYPDLVYGTQFTIYSLMAGGGVTGVESFVSIVFQVAYTTFLLVSPTSILLLFGLRITGVSYKEWIKYIYRFFIIVLFTVLIAVKINFEGLDLEGIIVIVLVLAALTLILYQRLMKKSSKAIVKKEEPKEDIAKKEIKEAVEKKDTAKKTSAKKTTTKKTTTKKTTKK